MATISGQTNERIFTIPKWLGLNEHPDGDTRLKVGEASEMVNWKITRDGNLKRRPGSSVEAGLMQDYMVEFNTGDPPTELGRYSATDSITVYTQASADMKPGVIVLTGAGGEPRGILEDSGSVSNGTWEPGTLGDPPVQLGVLNIAAPATITTIGDLATMLAGLSEGEFLYVWNEEKPYALNGNSLTVNNGVYSLFGWKVKSVPSDGNGNKINPQPVAGMWSGMVGYRKMLLAACDGVLYSLYDDETDTFIRSPVGELATDKGVSFFPFDEKVYILNGYEYYKYDGASLSVVIGDVPIVAYTIGPVIDDATGADQSGIITAYNVNRLIGKRRVWLSPDNETPPSADLQNVFQLPEKDIIDTTSTYLYVKDLLTNQTLTSISWDTANPYDSQYNGTYSFQAAKGRIRLNGNAVIRSVNSYEVGYEVLASKAAELRAQVTSMLYAELYSGQTDTNIWLYGDGTNRTIYSGMDENGQASAEYFPDQYEARVGDANTPITAMIRHYGDLVCWKTDSCWSLNFTLTSMPDSGDLMPAVYVIPVNKDKGNLAPGQVRLVDNNPVTCSGGELYHWINSSYYSSNISRDERQARRISDRVQASIKELRLEDCCMWDDNDNQEFYIGGLTKEVDGKEIHAVLVWNYAADAWYRYEDFDVCCFANLNGEVFFGTTDGKVMRLTYDSKGDNGEPIKARWVSGAMDFGSDCQRKYSSMMWVGLKPEEGTSVDVTVVTDRKNTFKDKVVSADRAKVPGQPFMTKTKIKAKKFVFYRLVLESARDSADNALLQPAVTVNNIDFRVRQTGYTK